MMILGERLKELRESQGISQSELARRIGVSRSAICNYENGRREKPSAPVVYAIAKALNVMPKDFEGSVNTVELCSPDVFDFIEQDSGENDSQQAAAESDAGTFNGYQNLARRTQNERLNPCERRMHALHGLSSEVGEIHALYQKTFQGHPLNADSVVDELGDRIKPNWLTNTFPGFTERHGLPRMRFHDLRHSCASLLLANGVPLKQIQDWLGHSDFATTANIYAHLDYTSKLSSAQAMVEGMALPEADHFGSRWVRNAEKG